ncbi:hypothetical protein G7Y79_00016g041200 [Physcia stellaris]|nr:hypothetical protein G7Y79_00016g041200 [Physcia stellaris]
MTSMNSDSSDEEHEGYTTTNVLLGYASKEATDDPISQLGGHPTWPDDTNAPSASFAKCKVCNRFMVLLLQLNGDLPEQFPGHERRIYIFACRSKTCKKKTGSIRALRGVKVSQDASSRQDSISNNPQRPQVPTPSNPPPLLGDSIFGTKSPSTASTTTNPFSSSSSTTCNPASNPFATNSTSPLFSDLSSKPPQRPETTSPDLPQTFAQKVRLSSPRPLPSPHPPTPTPHEPWPEQADLPHPYPSYHLDADYETLDDSSSPHPSSSAPTNFPIDEDSGGGGGTDKEAYESTHDTTFQRFATRLAQNPLQTLRYEFDGAPLLYSKTDAVGAKIPRCETCGGGRVFELQLVPQAIAELEVGDEGMEGMEWGTVMLGVCAGDCGDARGEGWAWREEWVGVQWEETGGGGGGVGVRR